MKKILNYFTGVIITFLFLIFNGLDAIPSKYRLGIADYSLVIAPVVADLCTTPVALSAPPNSYQNNSQS